MGVPRYQLNYVGGRCGLSAKQIKWAREIYAWWDHGGSLSMMPKEPDGKKEARGETWRKMQRGWVKDALVKRQNRIPQTTPTKGSTSAR